ncbi:MAG: RNA polymerase sigma factor [Muribaculaceae bacterium]
MAEEQIHNEALVAMLKDPAQRNRAFATFMKQYGRKLYWHIRRIVVAHDDAEDALQETAICIFNSIDSFNEKSSLGTWVYRIATNEALRVLRKQTHIFQSVDALGETLSEKLEGETDLDADSAEVAFQKAVLQLPTQQRIAFNMRYYDELSYEEIAKITGKNVNTLKTNYHFAVNKIKKTLTDNML